MRRVGLYAIILTAAALLPERGKAQNWEPFYKDSVYHFWPSKDQVWIHSYRLDSIVNGKYFSANNEAKDFGTDTCKDQVFNWMGTFLRIDKNTIAVLKPYSLDTEYYCFRYPAGRTWVVNKNQKITGTVIKVVREKLFNGIYDSVKYIDIVGPATASFELIISKNNGLITWNGVALYTNEDYNLTRFHPPSVFTKRMLNDFTAGDIFYYRYDEPGYRKTKYNTKQEIGSDSLYFTGETWSTYYDRVTQQSYTSHYEFQYGVGELNKIMYKIEDTFFGKKYINGELRFTPPNGGYRGVVLGPTMIRWLGVLAVQIRVSYFGILTPLYDLNPNGCYERPFEPCYGNEVYGIGTGFMNRHKYCTQNGWHYYLDEMMGYVHNNVLIGNIVLAVEPSPKFNVIIANPVGSQLSIKSTTPITAEGELLDLTGKKVLTFGMRNGEFSMDISYLRSGIYIIRIGDQSQKIVKL